MSSNNLLVMGLDPGHKGGLSLVDSVTRRFVAGTRLPYRELIKGRPVLDVHELNRWLEVVSVPRPFRIVIEQVNSMPAQGVASTFTFGRHAGALEVWATMLDAPMRWVTPAVWKKRMGLPSGAGKAGPIMDAARGAFGDNPLWNVKANDGIAEAALLALYELRHG